MSNMEAELKQFLDEKLTGVTPGAKIQAFYRGEKKMDVEWGETFPLYDLASLTKVIFTTSLIMNLRDLKRINLEDEVSYVLSWYNPKNKITNLLNHTAGNVFWLPIYEKINLKSSLEEKFDSLKNILQNYTPGDRNLAVYSDIDFLLLLFILEELEQKTISELWDGFKEDYYSDFNFFMNPLSSSGFKKQDFAPTENCKWRGRLLQGEVHDQNTWAMGGVSTHAGLFGDIESVSQWALSLREIYLGKEKQFVSPTTLKHFTQRSIPKDRGDWGLGFMMPTLGKASCGTHFHENSFGHTGFTGTSVWTDPVNDIIVVMLSNRVNVSVESKAFPNLRGPIHDKIFNLIKGV